MAEIPRHKQPAPDLRDRAHARDLFNPGYACSIATTSAILIGISRPAFR